MPFFHWEIKQNPMQNAAFQFKNYNPKLAFHPLKGNTAQFSIERSVQLTQLGALDMTLMFLRPLKKATFSISYFLS